MVNRLEVRERSIGDVSTAWNELKQLWANTVRDSPLIAVGLMLLLVTGFATKWSVHAASGMFRRRLKNHLLRGACGRRRPVQRSRRDLAAGEAGPRPRRR
ncbi:MAG TPA: hypothetical protein VGA56_21280 [Opitutaceae bacterium]